MEHRYHKRYPSSHKALIFKNGMPVAIGRIQNFSRSGIFIKTDIPLVDVHQSLDIEFIARSGSRSVVYGGERRLCQTLVMHKADSGVGLMVREDCAKTQSHFSDFFAEELESHQRAVKSIVNHGDDTANHVSDNDKIANAKLRETH
ncbi:MAG: PilZ domain-containing protein [Spongiibacteraceae bacterium]